VAAGVGLFPPDKHQRNTGGGFGVGCSCGLFRGWCSLFILWRFCGLFVFLPIICGLHVAVFGVSSYYMEKFNPGGGWCSVFVEKTNKEKKTRKRVKIFIKSVDTDTETC